MNRCARDLDTAQLVALAERAERLAEMNAEQAPRLAAHQRRAAACWRAEIQRRDDDQRAMEEGDEQRDYAEERANAELLHDEGSPMTDHIAEARARAAEYERRAREARDLQEKMSPTYPDRQRIYAQRWNDIATLLETLTERCEEIRPGRAFPWFLGPENAPSGVEILTRTTPEREYSIVAEDFEQGWRVGFYVTFADSVEHDDEAMIVPLLPIAGFDEYGPASVAVAILRLLYACGQISGYETAPGE